MPKQRKENPNGRPPYQPSADQPRQVRTMSRFGMPQSAIAQFIGISPKTLRKHFRYELTAGLTEAKVSVGASLFYLATTRQSVRAAIFWAKVHCGFRVDGDPPQNSLPEPSEAFETAAPETPIETEQPA